jgi:transposase-like protein
MYQFIWKWVQKYSILLAIRFVVIIGKRKVQKIFVDDETLLKINGQHY